MKNLAFPLLLLLTSITYGQGSNGLIAHWNFNGNANDVSGHNLNGIVYNASLTNGYNGNANSAYYFDGTSSYITIPYDSLMNIDSGSICMLLKVTSFYSGTCQQNTVLYRGVYTVPGNSSDAYSVEFGDNYYDYDCNIFSNGHEVFDPSYHTSNAGAGGLSMWYSNSDTIAINTWYTLTTTYAHDTIKVYIDSTLRKVAYMPDNYAPGTDSINIGYYAPGGSQYPYWFNGVIDDIRIYNRPLSDSEVIQYHDTALMSPHDNMVNSFQTSTLQVFPNPASSHIQVQLSDNRVPGSVQVFNTLGQVMIYIQPHSSIFTVDISTLPAGMYYIKASYEGQCISNKLLKE